MIKPELVTDESKAPPYPWLRCPRCKAIFSDHDTHICKNLNIPPAGEKK